MTSESGLPIRFLAAALRRITPRRGARIALLCPHRVGPCRVHHAVLAAGATAVRVGPQLTAHEIMRVLVDTSAVLLLCHSDLVTEGAEAARLAGIRMFTTGPPTRAPGSEGRLEDLAAGPAQAAFAGFDAVRVALVRARMRSMSTVVVAARKISCIRVRSGSWSHQGRS